jgi:hypothetical protein
MSSPWRQLPEPARTIATTTTEAVSAARSPDPDAFEQAVARLAALNPEQVGLVLGAVVRSLLEDLHPDGLTGDDVRAVLEHCVRSAAAWYPGVEPAVLVVLLTGALGVHQAEEEPRALAAPDIAAHAPLLIADLLAAAGRPLDGYLRAALAEIERSETYDAP